MDKQPRGLRFPFDASAEVATESSPNARIIYRVTELSLQGCFLKTTVLFDVQRTVILKIFHAGDFFEAKATVLYVQASGIGLLFQEVKPHFRSVLQDWILKALDDQLNAHSLQSESVARPPATPGTSCLLGPSGM
jgi:hypothetical protein